jgi:hypothetical protein
MNRLSAKRGNRRASLSSTILAACAAVALAAPAARANVLDGVTYHNVTIAGIAYDISFASGTYNAIFASSPATFLGNATGAEAAAFAITPLLPHYTGPATFADVEIPFLDNQLVMGKIDVEVWDTNNAPKSATNPTPGTIGEHQDTDLSVYGLAYAIFKPIDISDAGGPNGAPVPEPAGWPVLLTSLLALTLLARRPLSR